MDVLLSALVGLGGGLVIIMLMPDIRPGGATATARRRMALVVAGAVGGVVIGYAAPLVSPAVRGDPLAAAFAALAGALWVSWLTAAALSRRRTGEGETPHVNHPAPPARDVPAHHAARHALVEHLLDDATAHETGSYADVGRDFTAIRDAIPRDGAPETEKLRVALTFWRGWIVARDRQWQPEAGAEASSVGVGEWPVLARIVASDLAVDREISDPRVTARFAYVAPAVSVLTPDGATAAPAVR